MADHSAIEWTTATWNPVLGCRKVSPGCTNCYAILQAWMKQHHPDPKIAAAYAGLVERRPDGSLNWTGKVVCLPERLDLPLHWRAPRRIFVNSLSDLFHEDVPDDFIDQVFAVMAWAHWHTFQVLTKRPARMREYLTTGNRLALIENARCDLCVREGGPCGFPGDDCGLLADTVLPLPNVWLGVSVEDQAAADERIPLLLQTPAAVRFLSCEPLLGPVDLWSARYPGRDGGAGKGSAFAWGRGVQWVIVGGESGSRHRPLNHEWACSQRDQCRAAGVAFFGKQDSGRTSHVPLPADLAIYEFPDEKGAAVCA